MDVNSAHKRGLLYVNGKSKIEKKILKCKTQRHWCDINLKGLWINLVIFFLNFFLFYFRCCHTMGRMGFFFFDQFKTTKVQCIQFSI